INFRHESVKPFLSGFMISLIALGLITTNINALKWGKETKSNRDLIAYILTTVEFQNDENLARLYPDPQVVRERAEILKKYKLNVFASPRFSLEKLTLAEGTTLFHIDTINGRAPTQQDFQLIVDAQQEKTITISGWAADQKAGVAAGGVFINVDGQEDIPALYGVYRPDVAESFKNSHYRYSGFSASFSTLKLGKGLHTLSFKIVTANKDGYYVSKQIIILEIR
ncbi:MAG: hypothetical protein PHQ86_08270, partial [Dehalococcoidales bacterium]|nr:hypothetical protein [Dehalococcoidales bacterium]